MATKISKASTRKAPGKPRTEASRSRTAGRPIADKTAKGKAKTVASQLPRVSAAEIAASKKKFEQGILARGEAVQAGEPLPAGATHEIVGKARDGSPILKRKRFSMT
jgi:hypothetical protein